MFPGKYWKFVPSYSPYSKRTRMEFAWAVRCSASAIDTISSRMGANVSLLNSTTLMVLRKLSTERGEKNRAVPEVGST